MKILVTGGAGFIGSALIRHLLTKTSHHIVNVDKLTYAADLTSLEPFADHPGYRFERVDICDEPAIRRLYAEHDPDAVMHLAAETHVDRSIEGPDAFIRTNVMGTFSMLNGALEHWHRLTPERRAAFRFHHISTDEVYGSLGEEGRFTETTPYDPRSPYSASKAASDHLVSAWYHTHGLPILITNCSNNYGPYQFPEKLIPLMITKALAGQPLPVYGKGNNVRDWLYVDDHVKALIAVVEKGAIGGCYNVGGDGERTNLQVVESLCDLLDKLVPDAAIGSRRNLISFVADRPGHDFRYAMDPTKIREELGWVPEETFETGLEKTVRWYLDHRPWWQAAQSRGGYTGERLGLRATG